MVTLVSQRKRQRCLESRLGSLEVARIFWTPLGVADLGGGVVTPSSRCLEGRAIVWVRSGESKSAREGFERVREKWVEREMGGRERERELREDR